MSETANVNVRIPRHLHQAVKELAEVSHRSLNGQILACLEACVEGKRTTSGASLTNETAAGYQTQTEPDGER